MMRNETGQRSDLSEHANLVHLLDDGIQHLALERPKNDGLVLNRIHDESLARLDDAGSDHVDGCDSNYEAVLAGTGPLHLCVQFLLNCFHELRSKVLRMQEDFVFE